MMIQTQLHFSKLMCITLIAFNPVPGIPLLVLSNRDEFFDRPTGPPSSDHRGTVRAGLDLQSRSAGTWLAATPGHVGVLLNWSGELHSGRSRGELVDLLLNNLSQDDDSFSWLKPIAKEFPGFHLIHVATSSKKIHIFTHFPAKMSRPDVFQQKSDGWLCLSNFEVGANTPKILQLDQRVHTILKEFASTSSSSSSPSEIANPAALTRLRDSLAAALSQATPGAQALQDTVFVPGVKFGEKGTYGTRTQTIILSDTMWVRDIQPQVTDWKAFSIHASSETKSSSSSKPN